uniref:Uncharacterized protein n=1 Tax=Anguilla anguilla TaxID=7936 RepID=A0A0E9XGA7_ANGAN
MFWGISYTSEQGSLVVLVIIWLYNKLCCEYWTVKTC